MLSGFRAEGNITQHKKTIQTLCSVVIFSVTLRDIFWGGPLK